MTTQENIIIFDNDDELTDYCLSPNPVVQQKLINGKAYCFYDYPFTDMYNYTLNNNMLLTVSDENSSVLKHGAVNRGMITKKISNLTEWPINK